MALKQKLDGFYVIIYIDKLIYYEVDAFNGATLHGNALCYLMASYYHLY